MLAKYLAAACIMLITVLLTNVYTLVIALGGTVYAGEWFVGYTGFSPAKPVLSGAGPVCDLLLPKTR